jgi:hypothetical protein
VYIAPWGDRATTGGSSRQGDVVAGAVPEAESTRPCISIILPCRRRAFALVRAVTLSRLNPDAEVPT